MESTFIPNTAPPPDHFHPHQTEDFIILAGELTVKINSKIKVLKKGDALHIPAKQVHAMWNASNSNTAVSWITKPALDSEYLFETFTGLANDDKTDAKGKPDILQAALTITRFSNVFRLVHPPYLVQMIIFYFLIPIAYLVGYKPVYKKYLDQK
jgi:hypothetical protein